MKKQWLYRWGLFFLLAMICWPFTAVQAESEAPVFSLKLVPGETASSAVRGYYLFEAEAGATVESQITVTNSGLSAGAARLYVVDALTGQTSGTIFTSGEDTVGEMASWISLAEVEIQLDPGQSQLIPYRLSVPANARAGQHIAGIAVQAVESKQQAAVEGEDNQSAFQVVVNTRMVMAVQVDIPGERVEEMDVTAVNAGGSSGYQKLFVDMQNEGNVMLKPAGSLVVTDAEGQTVQSLAFQMGTFLPETQIAYPIFVENEALPAGSYTADLTLTYGETAREQSFQLPFEITEAQNEVVFGEAREALAAPPEVIGSDAEPQPELPYWQIFVTGGLGFIDAVLAFVLVALVYRYMRERRQRLAR